MQTIAMKRDKANQQPIQLVRGATNFLRVELKTTEGTVYEMAAGELLVFGIKMRPESKQIQLVKSIDNSALDGDAYLFHFLPDETKDLRDGHSWYAVGLQTGEDFLPVIEASPVYIVPGIVEPVEVTEG